MSIQLPVNYCELETELQNLVVKEMYSTSERYAIMDMVDKFRIPINIIKREIKIRKKEINRKHPRIKEWYDLPTWKDKSRCPLCNSKLVKKWEGLVCLCKNCHKKIHSEDKYNFSKGDGIK